MSNELQELQRKFLLPLKLQHFAGGDDGGDTGDDVDDAEDNDDDDSEDEDDGDDNDDEDDDEDDDDTKKKKGKKSNKKAKTYTQDEVDRIIKNRLAREKKKVEKVKAKETTSKKETKEKDDDKTNESNEKLLKQMEKMQQKMVQSEVKSALVTAGIDPAKVGKAMKLIDLDMVLDEDDEIDEKLLKREIKDLVKEFPNLKKANISGGFKFGSDGNPKADSKLNTELDAIFGNDKKK